MLKRKIMDELINWKNTSGHNPLVIKGCRQCGKTYAVTEFAKQHYENVIYINFYSNPNYLKIFDNSLEIDSLTMYMSAMPELGGKVVPGETVIILDEIQECPQARTSLKFWKMDGRYDVIATGSLLGVKGYGKEPASVPVGYETVLNMYPMDYEEFLWAKGIDNDIINLLENCLEERKPVPAPIHERLKELFLQYAIVGGMPAVVQHFVDSNNLGEVLHMQRDIVAAYKEDMIKYASKTDKPLITQCFDSIPKQLAKENKKYQYSVIKKGATAAKFSGSIQWIEEVGIINRCYNLQMPELPLEGNAIQEIFKVYMVDSGLFVSMLENGTQADILSGNLHAYKGAIFENLIADVFSKMNRKLYYYHKDSGLEIDFVTRYEGECVLIEVKASTGNTKSSRTILNHPEKYHINKCIKLGDYNVSEENQVITLPSYMAFLLRKY